MKRFFLLLLIIFVLCGCTKNEDVLRLHVVGNSDSDYDQSVKLKVKDEIYEVIKSKIGDVNSIVDGEQLILDNKEELIQSANKVLEENGADYLADINIGYYDFPTKTYNNKVYPAGKYKAVRVELGNAGGQNWWCVLFPPICFVDAMQQEEIENEEENKVEFKSLFFKNFGKE